MDFELIRFKAIDSDGNIHTGELVIDLQLDINTQISRYLQFPVQVVEYKLQCNSEFYQ